MVVNNTDQREDRAAVFLGTAFELSGGRSRRRFAVDEVTETVARAVAVASEVGFSSDLTPQAVADLVDQGLITQPDDSGQSQLTEDGADVVEPP